jgi:anti-sigma B factor antagonist
MKFHKKIHGDVCVIALQGRLKSCPEAQDLCKEVRSIIANKICNVVVDLKDLEWMGSVGIGALVGGLTTTRNNGGDLRLVRLNKKIESLLTTTHLNGIFKIYNSVETALHSFHKE